MKVLCSCTRNEVCMQPSTAVYMEKWPYLQLYNIHEGAPSRLFPNETFIEPSKLFRVLDIYYFVFRQLWRPVGAERNVFGIIWLKVDRCLF